MALASNAPSVVGVQHVALNVRDLTEALAFYRDVMGFGLNEARPDFGFPGAWLFAGAQQVHLMETADCAPDRRQHFALSVDDVGAWADYLTGAGVEFYRLREVAGAGRQIFVVDPSGNRVELNEPGH